MNTTELINAVMAHLNNIVTQSYTVCDIDMAAAIKDAGKAVNVIVYTGQFNPENNTCILYTEL